MHKFGMAQVKLIPLGDLSSTPKEAFSQKGKNLGFFLNFV
jgi:hypothetical protein